MSIVLVCVCVAVIVVHSFGAQYTEDGHIDDPLFKQLGYTCLSKEPEIGPMKVNETKNVRGNCRISSCRDDGLITHTACLLPFYFLLEDSNCKLVEGDKDKPYPECCKIVQC